MAFYLATHDLIQPLPDEGRGECGINACSVDLLFQQGVIYGG